jgi:PAB-dependent poly(A)-specific ribonuclease subunit 3
MQTSLTGNIIIPSKAPSVIPIVAPSSTEEQPKTPQKVSFKGLFQISFCN